VQRVHGGQGGDLPSRHRALTPTGSVLSARRGHGATVLPDGELIAGGFDHADATVVTSAEIEVDRRKVRQRHNASGNT
jgi:hypothetical protein